MNKNIVVVGAGHAGVEASLAIARMGGSVVLITQNEKSIARASCNPAIGGLGKGHLVKEIDALGGEMGFASDFAGIQFKMLNKSKGRAVWSPRAQIDKLAYSSFLKNIIKKQPNLSVLTGEVISCKANNSKVESVTLLGGDKISCCALVIATGTFLGGLIHVGEHTFRAGRFGEKPSEGLRYSLNELGFELGRLKTGTPPRILSSTINYNFCKESEGDKKPQPFSFRTPSSFNPPQEMCYLVDTNKDVHSIINDSIHKSALFSGKISGIGPRYCPSIEDKLVRFSDKNSHQLFLEPEWLGSEQVYVNGFSTSLPESVQIDALRAIPALKNVEFIRPGYAIEYDYIFPSQLKATLETKTINNLFFAGQINGTSGYEEAAAQGLIAGINAYCSTVDKEPLILKRDQAYIGVLIDDLITKTIDEPYRMFTSRAEFRLSLRPDTATRRLTHLGHVYGLISDNQFSYVTNIFEDIEKIKNILSRNNIVDGGRKVRLTQFLKQPKISVYDLFASDPSLASFSCDSLFTAETDIKYHGYVEQETKRAEKLKAVENTLIPKEFDYSIVNNLSNESREKLIKVRPETLGQASRIAGITQTDIAVLSIMLKS